MPTIDHMASIWGGLPFRGVLTVCLPPIRSTKALTPNGFAGRGT